MQEELGPGALGSDGEQHGHSRRQQRSPVLGAWSRAPPQVCAFLYVNARIGVSAVRFPRKHFSSRWLALALGRQGSGWQTCGLQAAVVSALRRDREIGGAAETLG